MLGGLMDEPLKMGSRVLDRQGDIWRRGRTRWTCTAAVDGRRVMRVGRLHWHALEATYGPLQIVPTRMEAGSDG